MSIERTTTITGISRQARIVGLPLPYWMGCVALAMFPFIWFKIMWWPLTIIVWFIAARGIVYVNPDAHKVAAATVLHTPRTLWQKVRSYGF